MLGSHPAYSAGTQLAKQYPGVKAKEGNAGDITCSSFFILTLDPQLDIRDRKGLQPDPWTQEEKGDV